MVYWEILHPCNVSQWYRASTLDLCEIPQWYMIRTFANFYPLPPQLQIIPPTSTPPPISPPVLKRILLDLSASEQKYQSSVTEGNISSRRSLRTGIQSPQVSPYQSISHGVSSGLSMPANQSWMTCLCHVSTLAALRIWDLVLIILEIFPENLGKLYLCLVR